MPFPLTEQELMPIIIRLITGTVGTAGFSIIFKMKPSRLAVACVGGLLTCAAYELAYLLTPTVIIASFLSAVFMALFSEIAARVLKAPAVIFIFPCLIPIVPGRALYYSIYHLLMSHPTEAANSAKVALLTVLGIAVGLGVASIFIGIVLQIIKALKKRAVESR